MECAISFAYFFATMLRDSARLHAVFLVSLALLVFEVNGKNTCKPDQILWKSDTKYKCLECPECPEGSQPSVLCGSSVKYKTPVHCVPCKLGEDYSNSYGKSQCQSCTVCSKGRGIKKNCTLSANTECDDKCIVGYYHEPLISGCFRCAECCGDEHDENATDCASGRKKCKIRSAGKPCKRKDTSTDATTTNDNKLSSTTSQPTKQEPTTTIRPTTQEDDRRQSPGDKMAVKYTENETLLVLVYVLIGFAALILVAMLAIICVIRRRQPADRPENNKDETEESIPLHEIEANSGKLTLEELEEKHFPEFQKMCLRLDNGKRADYEGLAAKYERISVDERESLHAERLWKEGSPSRALMSFIKTKYPNHPVVELMENLRGIGRDDIALILKPLLKNK